MGACHVRRRPGFIDENKLFGIEIRLRLKPGAPLSQDLGSILLGRVGGLFFRVRAWRWKNRDKEDVEIARPRSANRARNSSRLWSRSASKTAMTSACRASMRRDRVSPPCAFGAKLPVVRRWASHRMTEEIETPKRRAAHRRLTPASTADNARALKSIDRGLPIFSS
jgi:hypothetical protein